MLKSVTIIIPVYNAEKYLPRCIDSILAQTFTDFELLLINDGSKDKSGEICDAYAAKDSRVRVFHKENGGASAARNYGLDKATGKYICFIDADDWVDKDYIKHLLPEEGEDMVICSIRYEGEESWILPLWHKDYNSQDMSNSLNYIVEHMAVCSPCCKLLSRDIIERNNIRFDVDVCAGEDMLFVYDYIIKGVKRLRTISLPLYHYNIVESSLSHRVVPMDTTYYIMDALIYKLNKIGEKFNWDCSHALKGMLCTQFFNLLAFIKEEQNYLNKIKLLHKVLTNNNIRFLLYDKDYLMQRRSYGTFKKCLLWIMLFLYKFFF